jgi:hypothetical protein
MRGHAGFSPQVSDPGFRHAGRAGLLRARLSSANWLPPALGPGDWSIGMMAGRGTGWYFDRDRR